MFSQENFPVRTWETAHFLVGEKNVHANFKGTVNLQNSHVEDILHLLKYYGKKENFEGLLYIVGFFSPVYACYSFCVFFPADGKSRWDNFTTASISFSDSSVFVDLLLVEKS